MSKRYVTPTKILKCRCTICRKVEARAFISVVATKFTKDTLMQGDDIHIPVSLHHPYEHNNQIVQLATVGYEGRNCANTRLSVKAVRDIQRLGHLGLGKHSYWELGRILRREGITFPIGGIKGAWDEK